MIIQSYYLVHVETPRKIIYTPISNVDMVYFITKQIEQFFNSILNIYPLRGYSYIQCITCLEITHNISNHYFGLASSDLNVVENCIHLETLIIKNNNMSLSSTSTARWYFPNLENLVMISCNLNTLPQFILKSTRVSSIDCSNNMINKIPRVFLQLPRLNTLNLIDNDICQHFLPPFQSEMYYLGLQPIYSEYTRLQTLVILLKDEDINIFKNNMLY